MLRHFFLLCRKTAFSETDGRFIGTQFLCKAPFYFYHLFMALLLQWPCLLSFAVQGTASRPFKSAWFALGTAGLLLVTGKSRKSEQEVAGEPVRKE